MTSSYIEPRVADTTVNGVRLRYVDWGEAGRPPLVLLHGFSAHARYWDGFAAKMRGDFHVYALDQRGHGDSDWAEDYGPAMMPAYLSAFVDQLGLEHFTLVGHSMGGGGTLEAADSRPTLQAAIPLTPWNTDKTWNTVRVPTMIVGAENDSVASVRSHAEPFFTSLSATLDKAYLELNNASHFFPQSVNTLTARLGVAWLKRFVDDDTRYEPFLCPSPSASTTGSVSDYRSTCPF